MVDKTEDYERDHRLASLLSGQIYASKDIINCYLNENKIIAARLDSVVTFSKAVEPFLNDNQRKRWDFTYLVLLFIYITY